MDATPLPSAFVEYPPDLMDSHATDQCHDKHACGRRQQLHNPDRHRESSRRTRSGRRLLTRTTIDRTSNPTRGPTLAPAQVSATRVRVVGRRPDRTAQLFRLPSSPFGVGVAGAGVCGVRSPYCTLDCVEFAHRSVALHLRHRQLPAPCARGRRHSSKRRLQTSIASYAAALAHESLT